MIDKWTIDDWQFKVETAFESAKLNADQDRALPWFFQQKDRLTALYPDMSEFMIHIKILRPFGGEFKNSVKRRTTEKFQAEDIINILERYPPEPELILVGGILRQGLIHLGKILWTKTPK
ncbi:hypothetical protein O181_036911 [Austropuccinia psidii MF-1]|uniref:Uncharacterized protein n=1 Tax=Austropuccinia psidii MF-1 TaxID=1389203 RepID=A0A9Q3DB35_9BASI|nr:hypothetical protein [Austropuccinia psidii MF-1]